MTNLWNRKHTEVEFSTLLGKTIAGVEIADEDDMDKTIVFYMDDGSLYAMYHTQNCCEDVSLEDVTGDLGDLIGSPITMAEASMSGRGDDGAEAKVEDDGYEPDSFTWTFYKLATIKGYVDIRWYGASNGYYSETVGLYKVEKQ